MRGVIESHLSGGALDSLADDVGHGLRLPLKEIPAKYFYDERGSELFDRITRLPEYYPTRCERELLNRHAPEIVELTGADEMVELGAGTASKTRALLYAMAGRGRLRRYIPFDVSESTVRDCIDILSDLFPGTALHGVVGDFESHLEKIPAGEDRLVVFLGGTVGNFYPLERSMFLERLGRPGDWLLIGTDLVKDPAVIEAAYNDSDRRHRGVQPERAPHDQPRARRGLRAERVRPRRVLRRRERVGRDETAVSIGPDGLDRGAGGRARRRRGHPHRDQLRSSRRNGSSASSPTPDSSSCASSPTACSG